MNTPIIEVQRTNFTSSRRATFGLVAVAFTLISGGPILASIAPLPQYEYAYGKAQISSMANQVGFEQCRDLYLIDTSNFIRVLHFSAKKPDAAIAGDWVYATSAAGNADLRLREIENLSTPVTTLDYVLKFRNGGRDHYWIRQLIVRERISIEDFANKTLVFCLEDKPHPEFAFQQAEYLGVVELNK